MAMLYVNGAAMPNPSSMEFSIQGISSSDAGRSESLKMYTGKKGEVKKYSISWNNITPADAHTILSVMRPASYISVQIINPDSMSSDTDVFTSSTEYYVSDISVPFAQWFVGGKRYSKLSLSIIERK